MYYISLGLIKGRHKIKEVSDYICNKQIEDVTDVYGITMYVEQRVAEIVNSNKFKISHIYLYVTGLTVALVAAINAIRRRGIRLTLMHYDRETAMYFSQEVY